MGQILEYELRKEIVELQRQLIEKNSMLIAKNERIIELMKDRAISDFTCVCEQTGMIEQLRKE